MRISVNRADPGYRPDAHRYIAYLDGERQQYAVTADEEQGYVDRYVEDGSGAPKLNSTRTGFEFERVHGVVRIERVTETGAAAGLP